MARQFTRANSENFSISSVVTNVPCTMACWAYPDNDSDDHGPMWEAGASNHIIGIRMRASNHQVIATHRAGGVFGEAGKSSWTTGVWQHVGAVFAGQASRKAYLGGVPSGESTTDVGGVANISRTNIGVQQYNGPTFLYFMDGRIAEAAIWNVALTDAEVAILALGFSPLFVRPASLVFYAPLIRGVTASGGNDIDIVGGLILADNNTVTVSDHPRIIRPSRQLWTPFAAAAPAVGNPWYYNAQQAAGAA